MKNLFRQRLTDSSILGLGDSVNIDILPLDYSILDDIVYKYPAGDNYFAYISRGVQTSVAFVQFRYWNLNFV